MGVRPLLGRGAGSPSNTKSLRDEAYLHTKSYLDLCSHLVETDMGRKLGAVPLWGRGAGSPSNTTRSPGLRAEAYLHAKYHLDPSSRLATINMGRKFGAPPPFWGRELGSPSNTKSSGPRPTSIPSDILIHAVIWPQQIWAENWGLCPFGGGELGPHLTQCGQAEA